MSLSKKLWLNNSIAESVKHFERRLVLETDIAPYPKATLKVKLLVFDGQRSMSAYGKSIGATMGLLDFAFVHTATGVYQAGRESRKMAYADRHYFCAMAFHVGALNMELITHESVHAGFAIAKRRVRDPWRHLFKDPEEWVAYPAGIIAVKVLESLRKAGIYRG